MCTLRLVPAVLLAALSIARSDAASDGPASLDRSLLTNAEQAWLAGHPVVYEAETREANMEPLEFRDHQGVYIGITADYVALLGQRLGLKVEVVEYPSTEAAIVAVAAGHADLIGTIVATPERARQMNLSEPYWPVDNMFLIRADNTSIRSAADLAGHRIAVERGIRRRQILAAAIPDLHFVEAEDARAAVDLVRSGQADAYVGTGVVLRYLINKLGRQTLEIRGPVYLPPRNFVFGVRPDAPELLSMINRALASISESERHTIEARWSPDLPEPLHWRTVLAATWPYLAALAAMIAVVLAWNQSLRVQIRHRGVAEQRARAAQELAERATRTKSEFVASVSHEIRNPMNAILGMAHLLTENELPARQRDRALKLQRSAKSLLSILNDLLDLSKIEAGKLEIESVPFDLTEVLEHCAGLLGQQAAEKGLELSFATPPALPTALLGDPLRLEQVLLNLGTNAIKFTPAGAVTLRVEERSRDDAGVTLRFSVTDTGIGMSEDQVKRLFQPYTQGDQSISRRFGGTGLGLAISQQLVSRLGGQLQARSTLGVGSEFSFESRWRIQAGAEGRGLPGEAGRDFSSQPAAELRESAARPLLGMRLLVVDDNDINRELAIELLGAAGAEVAVARDGKDALGALAGGAAFDAVLMDYNMPVMDGYDATRAIRAHPQWHDLPIIATSADTVLDDWPKARAAGMTDRISKPIDVSILLTILQNWRARQPHS
jgi:signal transduction histidine kinase